DDNIYYWEIQYDKNNRLSYHTLTDVNPEFEWYSVNGEDFSGSYTTRLIAKTEQYAPSGNRIVCSDTVENTILLINDFLQFPNVITPNGDGINDRFIIRNLVEGIGYPYNSLAIYDRWGKRVYYKENIASEEDFWDPGKDNMPAGTYFFRFAGKGYLGNIQRTGSVEVLK
ncbi:MAG: gliding motility-associated C-terminal domain-containing protein, partial [Bacteroidales bacterium]|nr:gliding motility-associated C-terminal domain-containing protein [Bacteroidales bacterium]